MTANLIRFDQSALGGQARFTAYCDIFLAHAVICASQCTQLALLFCFKNGWIWDNSGVATFCLQACDHLEEGGNYAIGSK